MAKLTYKYFTANGSWTAPAGVTELLIIGCGGGAGGAGGSFSYGGGGGGAATQVSNYISIVPNTLYTFTIGSGGNGGAISSNGNDGGSSIFGATLFEAYGAGKGYTGGIGGANITNFVFGGFYNTSTGVAMAGGGGNCLSTQTNNGMYNIISQGGNYSGGLSSSIVTTYGGGGGQGPQGNGGNGGATGANAGVSAAANSGAGGGGGGGGPSSQGVGGKGGSGYIYVIWID